MFGDVPNLPTVIVPAPYPFLLGHGLSDPVLILRRERDDAMALAELSISHGEAALKARETATELLIAAYDKIAALEQRLSVEGAGDVTGDGQTPQTSVDTVIDQLDRRLVPEKDRFRLRRHLDKADLPDHSRAGQDRALGGAIGRKPMAYGLRTP